MDARNLDLSRTVGLTACDSKALYAVQADSSAYTIWFSNNAGESFTFVGKGKSKEIACDHGTLATLGRTNDGLALYTATTVSNGSFKSQAQTPVLGEWTSRGQVGEVDRLQGGDGMFYGVKATSSGNKVLTASNRARQAVLDWGSPIATIGAVLVTGTGGTITGSDDQTVGNSAAWPRRAFALEASGTVSTNDKLLDGNNTWTFLNTGSERYLTLSAAATSSRAEPNVLFGLQNRNGSGQIELNRITISEDDCDDGVDNDANGLVDAQDSWCEMKAADQWCANHAAGTYCTSRFVNDWAGGALFRCSGGEASLVDRGVCQESGTNADFLPAFNTMNISLPSGYGRWCNANMPNGDWQFDWGSSDPCAAFVAAGGTIVRAGIYSTSGKNRALANCTNGFYIDDGTGGEPLQTVRDKVRPSGQSCVFTIAPDKLPVFEKMFQDSHEVANRLANGFTHDIIPVTPTTSNLINRFGTVCDGNNPCIGEGAYDHALNEARPVYAVAPGRVLVGGSVHRDVTSAACDGTPNQGEIFVEHNVGSNSTYRESFLVGYAHLRKRLVQSGQTVKTGQILGYVGGSGCTSGGYSHLHTGVLRLTNVNAQKPGNPGFGYQIHPADFRLDMGGALAVDALGWAGPSLDPWGYKKQDAPGPGFTGVGAWSMALFKSGHAFDYP
jgi:hypothetical protein